MAKTPLQMICTDKEKEQWIPVDSGGVQIDSSGARKSAQDIVVHIDSKSNPHGVTKAQLGLSNVNNTSDASKPVSTATKAELDKKVDKVSGKQLSTNDYTNADKAEVGKVKNKADKTEIPTKLSQLEKDIELGKDYDEDIKKINDNIGNMEELQTEGKTVVSAINELKQHHLIYGFEVDETNLNPKTAVTYIGDNKDFVPVVVKNDKVDYGSWEDFIKKISYRVMVKNGVEQYRVQYDNPTKKLDGSDATLTGEDGDLFTKFTLIWRKYTKTTKGYRIELSETPFAGAKSLVTELENGYNQFNNPIMILIQDLYLLLFKDRDSQTALGRGYVDGNSDFINTGGTNGKGYIYGETTGKLQMCFLGIEDLWGNKFQWVDGLVSDSSYNILTGTKSFNDSGSGYAKFTTGLSSSFSGYAKTVQGDDAGYVLSDKLGSTSTGYCDSGYLNSGTVANFGGYRSDGVSAGVFSVRLNTSASYSASPYGTRLCLKNSEGVYVGNYLGYIESSKLRSKSGVIPTGDKKISEFRTLAQANN